MTRTRWLWRGLLLAIFIVVAWTLFSSVLSGNPVELATAGAP